MVGPFLGHAQGADGVADGLVADQRRSDAFGEADLGSEFQGPDTGGFAKGARALVHQGAALLAARGVDDGRVGMGARRAGRERGKATGVAGMDGVADGLFVAGEGAGDGRGGLAGSTGQEHVAAANRQD